MSRRKAEAVSKKDERPAKRQKKEQEEKKVFTRLVDRARYVQEQLKYELELERLKKVVPQLIEELDEDEWTIGDQKDWWMMITLCRLGPKRREFLRWMNEQGFPMMFNGEDYLWVFLHDEAADREVAKKRTSDDRRVVEADWKEP
jgi:hypothetical protein